MRVFFVNRYFHPDNSATSQMVSQLAFRLAAAGYDLEIVTSRQRYEDAGAGLPAQETRDGLAITRIWTTRFGRGRLLGRALDYLTFYLSAAWALVRRVSARDIVVAKTDPPMLSLIGAAVCRLRGGVLVNWCQDIFPEVAAGLGIAGANGALATRLRRLRNRSLGAAFTNVVLGQRMKDHLLAEGIPDYRITVIHNWADGRQIVPVAPVDNRLRQDWGLADAFVVGYSGNLGRAHDVQTVLDAATALRDRDDVVFLFIGGGAKTDQLAQMARERGLTSLRFRPYQDAAQIRESLSVPDLHLVTLLPAMEGLIVPSKIYGVAAAGRPCLFIGDTDGDVARLLRAHDCGYAVPVGDSAGAAEVVATLMADPALCRRLGTNARAAFEAHYDLPLAFAAWCRLLDGAGARR